MVLCLEYTFLLNVEPREQTDPNVNTISHRAIVKKKSFKHNKVIAH